MVITRATKS